jgi:hypothetical protein
MLTKYTPLILHHSNSNYFKNEIKSIKKLFKKSYNLNYQDFFNDNGDLLLKKKILNYIFFYNVNSLIIFSHNDNFQLSINFLKNIKNKTKIVFIFKDDGTNMLIHSRYYAIISDATITNCEFANSYYKSLNINSFLSSDSLPNKKIFNIKKRYDVSFIGSFLKEGRKEYIEFIKKQNLNFFFLDTSKDENRISQKKYDEIIKATKINLNFSSTGYEKYNFFQHLDPFINNSFSAKGRIIEIGLKKSFVLSEYASEAMYFWKKNEVVTFYNKKDMLNKILYYLNNEKKRKRIANNLFQKCVKERITKRYNNKLIHKVFNSFERKIFPDIYKKKINLSHYKNLEGVFLLVYILKMIKTLKFKSIIFTLNRFLSLNLTNIFHAPIHVMRYFYYFYLKKVN